MSDYSISWAYIVSKMEERYGMPPDNEEKMAFGDIEKYLSEIWSEYVDIKDHDDFANSVKATFNKSNANKFGKWLEEEWTLQYVCSVCHHQGSRYKTDYCPNCGAKMDL